MPATLYVRDVPDEVHSKLLRRASERGLSLRQYVASVLADHCALPTMDEWLGELGRLPAVPGPISGAEAVRDSRLEDEEEVLAGAAGR